MPAILLLPFRADLYSFQKMSFVFATRSLLSMGRKGSYEGCSLLAKCRSVSGCPYRNPISLRGAKQPRTARYEGALYPLSSLPSTSGSAQNSSRLNLSTVFVENTRMVAAASAESRRHFFFPFSALSEPWRPFAPFRVAATSFFAKRVPRFSSPVRFCESSSL